MRQELIRVLGVVHGQGWTLQSPVWGEDGNTPTGETVVTPVIAWVVVERKSDVDVQGVDGPLYYRQLIPLTVDSGGVATEGVQKGEQLVPPGGAAMERPAVTETPLERA